MNREQFEREVIERLARLEENQKGAIADHRRYEERLEILEAHLREPQSRNRRNHNGRTLGMLQGIAWILAFGTSVAAAIAAFLAASR